MNRININENGNINDDINDDINSIMGILPSIISDNLLIETFNQLKNAKIMIKICKEKIKRGIPFTEKEERAWVTIHIFLAHVYPNNTNYSNYKDHTFLLNNFLRYYISNTKDDVLFEKFPQLYIDVTSQLLIEICNKKNVKVDQP